jgi:hypothetical protein
MTSARKVFKHLVRAIKKWLRRDFEYAWVDRALPCLVCATKGKEILLTGREVKEHFKKEHPEIEPKLKVVFEE